MECASEKQALDPVFTCNFCRLAVVAQPPLWNIHLVQSWSATGGEEEGGKQSSWKNGPGLIRFAGGRVVRIQTA